MMSGRIVSHRQDSKRSDPRLETRPKDAFEMEVEAVPRFFNFYWTDLAGVRPIVFPFEICVFYNGKSLGVKG